VSALALVLLGAAWAADPPSRPGLVLPEPPAAVLVGGAQGRFDEASAPADLAASAGSFFDSSGKLVPGGALEVGVRAFGLAKRTSAAEYEASAAKRVWANSFFSVATAQDPVTGDLLGAAGARITLWQQSDPYREIIYRRLVGEAAAVECDAKLSSDPDPAALSKLGACVEEAYTKNASQLKDVDWNQNGTVLSLASSVRFPDGKLSAGTGHDMAAWISQSIRAGEDLQLGVGTGGSLAMGDHPHMVHFTGLARGALSRTRLRTELGVEIEVPHGDDAREAWVRYPVLVGGEYEIGEGAWLAIDFGMRFDPGEDVVTLLSQGTFRWGNMKEPTFGG
jgi:hypothetical protein